MWKCDNITHSMKIYSCTLCGWWRRRWRWCPGADREETHFEMAWRKLNVVSDNCHIHIYRHHMLLFSEESLCFHSLPLFLSLALNDSGLLLVCVSHTAHLMYWIYFDRKKEEIMSTKTARNLIKTSKPNLAHNNNASMAHMQTHFGQRNIAKLYGIFHICSSLTIYCHAAWHCDDVKSWFAFQFRMEGFFIHIFSTFAESIFYYFWIFHSRLRQGQKIHFPKDNIFFVTIKFMIDKITSWPKRIDLIEMGKKPSEEV